MKRQNIIIGEYTYILDLYKAGIDIIDNPHYEKFCVIRKYDVMNGIVYDTEMYFIEQDIIDSVTDEDGVVDTDRLSEIIAYPKCNDRFTGYSVDFTAFNSDFSHHTFNYANDIYKIYGRDLTERELPCDKLRIYKPTNNNSLDAIIHVDNYISDIHFHYLCRPTSSLVPQAETEFHIGNVSYSEYYEVFIPNIETLFEEDSAYIVSNFNINEVSHKFQEDPVSYEVSEAARIIDGQAEVVLSVTELTPWRSAREIHCLCGSARASYRPGVVSFAIQNEDANRLGLTQDVLMRHLSDTYKKCHFTFMQASSSEVMYLDAFYMIESGISEPDFMQDVYSDFITENPVTITQLVRLHVDNAIIADGQHEVAFSDSNGFYFTVMPNATISSITDSFVSLSTLVTPFIIQKDSQTGTMKKTFLDIRKTIENNWLNEPINVTLFPHNGVNDKTLMYELRDGQAQNTDIFVDKMFFRLMSQLGFNNGTVSLVSKFSYPSMGRFDSVQDAYFHYYGISISDYREWAQDVDPDEEDDMMNIPTCGFHIEMASDSAFKNVFYKYDATSSLDDDTIIDDYAFQLNGIFDSWDEVPEIIVMRAVFVDRMMANKYVSNTVMVTSEWFKYFINAIDMPRMVALVSKQAENDGCVENKYTDSEMDLTKFNFIDKINCIVKREEANENTMLESSKQVMPKVLYKPVFYRTQELQSIKIKAGLTQNIGINLSEYMTKVETFKLVIDHVQYVEYARNDIFVIFKVNALDIEEPAGMYNILNQDDEYLSDGRYSIYA